MTEPIVVVTRGEPTDSELAALTVAICLLAAERCDATSGSVLGGGRATWRHGTGRYRSPVSWRHDVHRGTHAA